MLPGSTTVPRNHMITAWIIVALLLLIAVEYRLIPALFAGLLVYELVHLIAPHLTRTSERFGKVIAVTLLAAVVVTLLLVIFFAALAFFRSETSGFSPLMEKVGQILEQSRSMLPDWVLIDLPDGTDDMRTSGSAWMRRHMATIGLLGRQAATGVIHVIIGMVVGALVALREALPDKEHGPLAIALMGRAARLADAFGRIVFAQVRIAAINTALTALYVVVVLPLFGVNLPFKTTLVAVTFLAGLLPVLGNLISNTFIVIASLSISVRMALVSLAFLVVIHKMEYFLNARIVGRRIEATPWELLIAMVVMEAVFGLAGLVAAPVYYAYLKDELMAADQV